MKLYIQGLLSRAEKEHQKRQFCSMMGLVYSAVRSHIQIDTSVIPPVIQYNGASYVFNSNFTELTQVSLDHGYYREVGNE